jgi:hypothetical protein
MQAAAQIVGRATLAWIVREVAIGQTRRETQDGDSNRRSQQTPHVGSALHHDAKVCWNLTVTQNRKSGSLRTVLELIAGIFGRSAAFAKGDGDEAEFEEKRRLIFALEARTQP